MKKTIKLSPESEQFLTLFIKPLLKMQRKQGAEVSVRDALDSFFNVDERQVFSATVKRPFKLPGHLLVAGNKIRPNTPKPMLQKGDRLLISLDMRLSFVIIELENGITYRVRKVNFLTIKEHLGNFGTSNFRDEKLSSPGHRD